MLSCSGLTFTFLRTPCPGWAEVLQLSPCIKPSGAKRFSFVLFTTLLLRFAIFCGPVESSRICGLLLHPSSSGFSSPFYPHVRCFLSECITPQSPVLDFLLLISRGDLGFCSYPQNPSSPSPPGWASSTDFNQRAPGSVTQAVKCKCWREQGSDRPRRNPAVGCPPGMVVNNR